MPLNPQIFYTSFHHRYSELHPNMILTCHEVSHSHNEPLLYSYHFHQMMFPILPNHPACELLVQPLIFQDMPVRFQGQGQALFHNIHQHLSNYRLQGK